MHQKNYKRRIEKRQLRKCPLCRTYNPLMTAYADLLEKDDTIVSFQCNVPISGNYTTDFVCKTQEGATKIRECVLRNALKHPNTTKLLDISRNYWLSHHVEDWGIVIDAEK